MLGRAVALLGLSAFACGPAMASYAPVEQKTEVAPDKLSAAAEGVLLDRGNLIASRSATRVETKERGLAGSDFGKDQYRYTWIVEIGDGVVRIRSTCRRVSGDDSRDCGDERPEKLVKEQGQLLEAILAEASGP